jgi:hypothetical protein
VNRPADKVCEECDGILKWYPSGFYMHWGTRYWVIKGHAPKPKPSYEPEGQ